MISIIVPVYKVERYLHQCLDSILNQTYRNLEILLIDDGSPDKCGDICEEYAQKDKRIRVFHTENKGLSAARNLGLREAKGEYIGFVDSDDWIEPNMYEILLWQLEETGTNVSACGVWKEYQECKCDYSICDGFFSEKEAILALMNNLTNGVWNKLYKKDCWTEIRFPDNHLYEEHATSYRVILNAHSVSCIPKQLYHYRMRDSSIVHTQSMNHIIDYWTAIYDRHIYLCSLPEFKQDQEMLISFDKQIALATARTWLLTYRIPLQQRNYVFLHKVSLFVRNCFPVLGKKNWKWSLRIKIFFSRYASNASLTTLHMLGECYHFCFGKNREQHYTLFP